MPGSSVPEKASKRPTQECVSPPPPNREEDVKKSQGKAKGDPDYKPLEFMSTDFPNDFMGDLVVQDEDSVLSPQQSRSFGAPVKFWKSVEPYCAPISQDQITLLEDLLKDTEMSDRLLKIPPERGAKHFHDFLMDDLETWRETGYFPESRGVSGPPEAKKSRKEEIDPDIDKPGHVGYLIQKAVSSLAGLKCDDSDTPESATDDSSTVSAVRNVMNTNFANGPAFEKAFERELEANGFGGDAKEDDELMQDWQMIVKRLNTVTKTNKEILTYLLKQAKLAAQKQEVVKKLDQIDHVLLEMHLKLVAAKEKKKSVGTVFAKKDKETSWKYLLQRQQLVEEIKKLSEEQQKMYALNPLELSGPSPATAEAFCVDYDTDGEDDEDAGEKGAAKAEARPSPMEVSK